MAVDRHMWLVFLAVWFPGNNAATVTFGGTSTAEASKDDIWLTCSYSLITNETAQTLSVTRSTTQIIMWNIPSAPTVSETNWSINRTSVESVTLRLPGTSVTKSSGGTYTCTVVTTGTAAGTYPKTHAVNVQYKPVVSITGNANVVEGQTVTLMCSADANPAATLKWKRGTSELSNGTNLAIPNINRNQSSTYTCEATNSKGTTPKTQVVTVYYFDDPQMAVSSETVAENSSVTFICSAASNPPAAITIERNSRKKTSTNGSVNYSFTAGCLDTGEYTCSAKNSKIAPEKQIRKSLSVLCKPRKDPSVQEETDFVRNRTESVLFKATLLAYPPPTFEWTVRVNDTNNVIKISNETDHFEIINTDKTSQLNVTVGSGNDFGEYTLKAKNRVGETTLQYYLRTQTAPFKVSTLDTANVTTDSITVKWSSSFNGGASQNYYLQYLPMSDSQQGWTQKTAHIGDPGRNNIVYARISDIHPGRGFRIRVFSINKFGQSEYSNEVSVTTLDLPSQLSVGVGIAIGLVISILLAAIAAVGIFLYRRRMKPKSKGETDNSNYANRVYNRQASTDTTGGGVYSGLDGNREKPPTYDALDREQPVYQNVERRDNGSAAEPSTPEVYMNFQPDQTGKPSDLKAASNTHNDGQVYANT